MRPCEMCGRPCNIGVNGIFYCVEHVTDGLAVQARLNASLAGAPHDVVADVGVWAVEAAVDLLRRLDEGQ